MKTIKTLLKLSLLCLISMLLGTGFVAAAEIDDAAVFVEAFNAFQNKDYLLAIEKCNQINQAFPETPLRDITLLFIARSSFKSGNNQLAAVTLNKFMGEFPDSALAGAIEEDLLAIGARQRKGETLQPNKQLEAAALKVRDIRLERERVAALKLEQEKLAREKAERERIAMEKAESERRERERLAAEKAEKESIKTVITFLDGSSRIAAGQRGDMPVEISNPSKNSHEFLLEVSAASEYGAFIASASKPDTAVTRINLASGETFKGKVFIRMPADKVDGNRVALAVKTISGKYSDLINVNSAMAITSAPLVRVVGKLAKPKVVQGERLHYKVSVLNIGSLPAEDLTVRIQLPAQLDFIAAPDLKFQKEKDGSIVFKVERVDTGRLADITMEVKVKDNSRIGQELRSRIDVDNGQLHRKETFNGSPSVVVQGQ